MKRKTAKEILDTRGIYSFEQYMTDVNVSFITEYLKKGSVQIDEDLTRVLETDK